MAVPNPNKYNPIKVKPCKLKNPNSLFSGIIKEIKIA